METRVSTLPNGLRVVSHEMPHLETVSLGVWIAAGSRDEKAGPAWDCSFFRAYGV